MLSDALENHHFDHTLSFPLPILFEDVSGNLPYFHRQKMIRDVFGNYQVSPTPLRPLIGFPFCFCDIFAFR